MRVQDQEQQDQEQQEQEQGGALGLYQGLVTTVSLPLLLLLVRGLMRASTSRARGP